MSYVTDIDGTHEGDLIAGDCSSLTATTSAAIGDEDKPVKPTGDLAWGLLTEDDDFAGVVRYIERTNEVCTVQVHGVVTLGYTGTPPTVGWQRLVGSATVGSVKIDTAAAASPLFRILEVDTTAVTVTFLIS